MELVRLTKTDYEEWLELLNGVFGRAHGSPMDFESDLPKMCIRDEEHMGMHLGIRADGGLRAVLGIYPLPIVICGQKLLFSTVGNVATHHDYEGRGYMKQLMNAAMEELTRIGADASRLGGLRQRYTPYGYEKCGSIYYFTLSERNRIKCLPEFKSDLRFAEIGRNEEAVLRCANDIQRKSGMAVIRSNENACRDVYHTMTAWKNKPYGARRPDGTLVGYLCASGDGSRIAEAFADDPTTLFEMLLQWQIVSGATLSFSLMPWQTDAVRHFCTLCEGMTVSTPSSFKIISWAKATDALLKLKASYTALPGGEFILGIEGYGNIRLYVSGGECGCERTEKSATLTLDRLSAARFLFGPLPPCCTADVRSTFLDAVLPLPLSWDTQDRV